MGLHTQEGLGIQKDLAAAFHLFKKAAESDHIAAQYHLGNCYEKGLGCELDLTLATRWFERAALGKTEIHIYYFLRYILNLFFISAGCRNSHERLRLLIVRECLLSPGITSSTINEEDLIYGGLIIGHSAPAA